MYSILFHLLWLSLLEIIFYFEYIGPLETKTYKNTIKRLADSNYDNNNYLIDPYNISNIINLNDIEYNTKNSEKERIKYNKNLYIKSIDYWLILLSFVLFLYFSILIYKYYIYLQNKNTEQNIEFITIRNRTLSSDIENSDDNQINTQNNMFFNYNKIKKTLKKKIIFYILLGALILSFEYLFFNFIVMKYKVLSDDEIIALIYKLINPLLDNFFTK